MTTEAISVVLRDETDIVEARSRGRALAGEMGMRLAEATLLATAISEIARNAFQHAGGGEVLIEQVEENGRVGIRIETRDRGSGIADVQRALEDGYSTVGGLGLGLPGARRLMDAFEVESSQDEGTVVVMKKWITL